MHHRANRVNNIKSTALSTIFLNVRDITTVERQSPLISSSPYILIYALSPANRNHNESAFAADMDQFFAADTQEAASAAIMQIYSAALLHCTKQDSSQWYKESLRTEQAIIHAYAKQHAARIVAEVQRKKSSRAVYPCGWFDAAIQSVAAGYDVSIDFGTQWYISLLILQLINDSKKSA